MYILFLLTAGNVLRILSAKNICRRENRLRCVEANTGPFCVSFCSYCLQSYSLGRTWA